MTRVILTPEQILELHLERQKVPKPTMEVLASRYDVSVRTLHRMLDGELTTLILNDWETVALVSTKNPPQLLAPWTRREQVEP